MPIRHLIGSLLILGCLAQPAAAQQPGDLLVANPIMNDPNFRRTVMLVVHHASDGAIAVALNRPTWVEPQDAFPDLDAVTTLQRPLYFGGPSSPNQLLTVFEDDRTADELAGSREVVNGVFVTANLDLLTELAAKAAAAAAVAAEAAAEASAADGTEPAATAAAVDEPRLRVYAGHATWGPGQLESEIAAGGWRVLPGRRDQIFSDDAENLWRSMPMLGDGVTAYLR